MSNKSIWSGRVLSGLAAAFLFVDAGMKVVKAGPSVEGSVALGYPESTVVPIGIALLISTILYVIPQTAVWGAVFLTGYLGGAIATNVRVSAPLFSNVLFPIYVAVFVWGGLYLRDRRVRALVSSNS